MIARTNTTEMPALFVSHGAPSLALEPSSARHFLCGLSLEFPRPCAIVVVSAHWEADEVWFTAGAAPATVHDFFGFPAPLYGLNYPAPGAVTWTSRVQAQLACAGFKAAADPARGFDHGAWVPLLLMYPQADIPVMQISISPHKSPAYHWRLGRALGALRRAGVLVLASGAMTHNLQDFRAHRAEPDAAPEPYAVEFVEWMAAALARGDIESLLGYRESAPHAERAHPTTEHLLPLFVALGAAGVSWSAERIHHSMSYGAIAMDAYSFHATRNKTRRGRISVNVN